MPAEFYYDLFEVKELISETAWKIILLQKKKIISVVFLWLILM